MSLRTPEGIERRRLSDKIAKDQARRLAGVPQRTKLSAEDEAERGRRYSAARFQNLELRKKLNETRRLYSAKKRTDPMFRLVASMRSRISTEISKQFPKPESTLKALGCNFGELKNWLENQFDARMSWDTYGRRGWHVDHIKPVASFDLSDPVQFAECCHYTNLQPLWWDENLAKKDKLNWLPPVPKEMVAS